MIVTLNVAWVAPLIAACTVVGVGYYTVRVVGKLEAWRESAEERIVALEQAEAIRQDRDERGY